MSFAPSSLEPVPFGEVADVLADAARRSSGGGPLYIVIAQGRDLASALENAGFVVMRRPSSSPQLTL
jgi:hypothetical protein